MLPEKDHSHRQHHHGEFGCMVTVMRYASGQTDTLITIHYALLLLVSKNNVSKMFSFNSDLLDRKSHESQINRINENDIN